MQALAAEAINKVLLAESQRDRQHRTFCKSSECKLEYNLAYSIRTKFFKFDMFVGSMINV